MVAEKPPITTNIASLTETESDIWKRLTIIKTEAWFNTVQAIAAENQGVNEKKGGRKGE